MSRSLLHRTTLGLRRHARSHGLHEQFWPTEYRRDVMQYVLRHTGIRCMSRSQSLCSLHHACTPSLLSFHTLKVSPSNPWMESSTAVAIYSGGGRVHDAEVQETNVMFDELMRRLIERALECDDPRVPVTGSASRCHTPHDAASLTQQFTSNRKLCTNSCVT